MPWIKSGFRAFIPSLTWQVAPQVAELVRRQPSSARILDLGAGGRLIDNRVIGVDFQPFPNTRVVADIETLPFASASIDLIIATGLLEHVRNVETTIREFHRVLKPGGLLHVEVPFLQQYHDDPIDCRRFTRPGLVLFLEQNGFSSQKSGCHIGPTVAWITLTAYYLALWFEGPSLVSRILSNAVFLILSIALFPLKYLDKLLLGRTNGHRLAFGVFCTATRSSTDHSSPR
ncbi:MAG: class I SAM-dependent methyltransferase [Magnetococcales bacterium]|nr:class I SAM-dependent methyltransferase [Magnetococcales bacterium]